MLLLVAIFVICVVYIGVNYYKTLCYWKVKGVKYITPLPIVGNSLPTIFESMTYPEYVEGLYKRFPNERYCGTFQYSQPIFLLRDLDLIKKILTKEYNTFSEHPLPPESGEDTLWGRNLFAAKGEIWKQLRQIISPAFTATKLKSMFGLMQTSAKHLMDFLSERNENVIEIELRDIFKRYSADTIASVAFGIDNNSFKDMNNDFMRMGYELTSFSGIQKLKTLLYTVHPFIAKLLNVKMHPDHVSNFFRKLVKGSIKSRENGTIRPDYIQHLLEARKTDYKNRETESESGNIEYHVTEETDFGLRNKITLKLTDDDITAQAIDFFYGGFYSTSSLMYFCIYELALNPEIQDELREEVDEASRKCNGDITYDVLTQMKFLDMVISETLRKWPTATWIDRKSNEIFVVDPVNTKEKLVYLEAGTVCWVPVFAIHRDPNYWPNPEKFDPQRFSDNNRKNIHNFSYLPFGGGPRNCVGSRFAIIEAKLVIFQIISSYIVIPVEKSVLVKNSYLTSANSFWFGFKRRQIGEKCV